MKIIAALSAAALAAALLPATATQAGAALSFYSSQTAFDAAIPGYAYESFASVRPGPGVFVAFDGPLTLNGITYDSKLYPGAGGQGLVTGGIDITGDVNYPFVGLNRSNDTLEVIFATPVSAWAITGIYAFPFGGADVTLTINGVSGVLGTTTLTGVPDGGLPTYFGVTSTDLITEIDLTSAAPFVELAGLPGPSVPEPMSLSLLGVGLLGLFAIRRNAP